MRSLPIWNRRREQFPTGRIEGDGERRVASSAARAHTGCMNADAGQATREDEPIVVYQSTDREGSTFSLSSDARRILRERFGDKIHFAPRIFIAHDTRDDFERLHGSLAKQLVALLTGLSDEYLAQVAVEFRDPVTERSL